MNTTGDHGQLTNHIKVCSKHPMRSLEAINAELLAALKSIADVGREYYDMDMGENGSAALEQADAAIANAERHS